MIAETEAPTWRANVGPQARFLRCTAYEALYGGAAGGGKSDALLMAALRFVGVPAYRALLLRRTFPELQRSLIARSRLWYPMLGAQLNEQLKAWRFPSGATIEFGHLEHAHDVHAYQSAEYQFLGFDELTTFMLSQYRYMRSRCRSAQGLPVYIRSASNPGGEGHDWVQDEWAPWLNTALEYKGPRAEPGQALRYHNAEDGIAWAPDGPLSRVFIPAKVTDNPHLINSDPAYVERLRGLDPVTRAQLLDGNWMARPAAGAYFKRHWIEVVNVSPAPATAPRIRYWDRAATEAHKGNDPDWTVGLLMARHAGQFIVEDVIRLRGGPGQVEAAVTQATRMDPIGTIVGIEQDPGQAGKVEAAYYVRTLAGLNVRCYPVTKDKITRAQPASAQCERGNLKLVAGPWNAALLGELEAFPEGSHDDQVDATSGALNALIIRQAPRYTAPEDAGERRI